MFRKAFSSVLLLALIVLVAAASPPLHSRRSVPGPPRVVHEKRSVIRLRPVWDAHAGVWVTEPVPVYFIYFADGSFIEVLAVDYYRARNGVAFSFRW